MEAKASYGNQTHSMIIEDLVRRALEEKDKTVQNLRRVVDLSDYFMKLRLLLRERNIGIRDLVKYDEDYRKLFFGGLVQENSSILLGVTRDSLAFWAGKLLGFRLKNLTTETVNYYYRPTNEMLTDPVVIDWDCSWDFDLGFHEVFEKILTITRKDAVTACDSLPKACDVIEKVNEFYTLIQDVMPNVNPFSTAVMRFSGITESYAEELGLVEPLEELGFLLKSFGSKNIFVYEKNVRKILLIAFYVGRKTTGMLPSSLFDQIEQQAKDLSEQSGYIARVVNYPFSTYHLEEIRVRWSEGANDYVLEEYASGCRRSPCYTTADGSIPEAGVVEDTYEELQALIILGYLYADFDCEGDKVLGVVLRKSEKIPSHVLSAISRAR